MGDPGGELPQRGHLLSLNELRLCGFQLLEQLFQLLVLLLEFDVLEPLKFCFFLGLLAFEPGFQVYDFRVTRIEENLFFGLLKSFVVFKCPSLQQTGGWHPVGCETAAL